METRDLAICAVAVLLAAAIVTLGSVRGCQITNAAFTACIEKTGNPLACDAARRGR